MFNKATQIFLLVFLLSSCSSYTYYKNKDYTAANNHLKKQEYDKAHSLYEKLLKKEHKKRYKIRSAYSGMITSNAYAIWKLRGPQAGQQYLTQNFNMLMNLHGNRCLKWKHGLCITLQKNTSFNRSYYINYAQMTQANKSIPFNDRMRLCTTASLVAISTTEYNIPHYFNTFEECSNWYQPPSYKVKKFNALKRYMSRLKRYKGTHRNTLGSQYQYTKNMDRKVEPTYALYFTKVSEYYSQKGLALEAAHYMKKANEQYEDWKDWQEERAKQAKTDAMLLGFASALAGYTQTKVANSSAFTNTYKMQNAMNTQMMQQYAQQQMQKLSYQYKELKELSRYGTYSDFIENAL